MLGAVIPLLLRVIVLQLSLNKENIIIEHLLILH